MPEPTLADLFAEAITLLEGKGGHVMKVAKVGTDCIRPFLEHTLDPAYDALQKVVTDGSRVDVWWTSPVSYWTQAPNKALEGALIGAISPLMVRVEGATLLCDKLVGILLKPGDTRIPTMQAVVAWLKENA